MSVAGGPVLIVGQGLAGTLLARALEKRAVRFVIADAGHRGASSRVGAGIINPITGIRMVKSAGLEALLPAALSAYRELEAVRGRRFLREMKVRRSYVDDAERAELRTRLAAGKLAPYVAAEEATGGGFVIQPAWQVNLPGLIESEREHWRRAGCLEERTVTAAEAAGRAGPVVWCDGAGVTGRPELTPVRGSLLEIDAEALEPAAILNRGGRWLLPLDGRRAWVGATYVRAGTEDPAVAQAGLVATAQQLLGDRSFRVNALVSGVRMTTADRRPLVEFAGGRGWINGLGSKGALHAPAAAERIADALVEPRG